MRKIIFGINITADGYCSHTDGIADEELHEYFTGLLRNSDVILFGRKTYELMVPYWPDVAKNQSETKSVNEFALIFDSLDKIVFSRTMKHADSEKTRISSASIEDEVIRLRQQPGKNIAVGSLSLASQLTQLGLIDEYHFVVHPVIAGKGPRLFEAESLKESLQLKLISSKQFRSGAFAHHYRK